MLAALQEESIKSCLPKGTAVGTTQGAQEMLTSYKHLLLLQNTGVWFLAPTPGSSKTWVTPPPKDLKPSFCLLCHVHAYVCVCIHTQINK